MAYEKTIGVDLAKLGPAVRRSIQTVAMDEIGLELFRFMNRDGKPLSDQLVRDAAYQRNWSEYAMAMWRSLNENRFLSLFDSLADSAKGSMKKKTEDANQES